MCFMLCSDKPPSEVKAQGARGQQYGAMLHMQGNPNEFALGLKDAPCAEPGCCLLSSLGAFGGCTACWARKKVLDTYYNGIDDFVCCQGYLGCCCIQPGQCCQGSPVGLCLEGCCCPMISLSVARIHLMDSKRIHPDPYDWQIIEFSNCLQLISCIFNLAADISQSEELHQAAAIIDLIADLVTCSVAGCMGAQVYHETKADTAKKAQGVVVVVNPVVVAVPVVPGQPVQTAGVVVVNAQPVQARPMGGYGAPQSAEMVR